VQAAIAELDSETQTALGGKAPSSAATAVGTSFTPAGTISATNVQEAIAELDNEKQAVLPARTWQSFTVPGQRALGTTYTNNTGQDIIVRVRISLPSVSTNLQCTVNGQTLLGSTIATSGAGADQWTIPAGATYQPNLSAGATGTVTWFELRP
jgi:hypothetical protein